MALLETRFYARSIDLSISANIILPEHSDAWKEPPAILYLLHGLSGDHTSWCRSSSIERYARAYNLAVVMPDAHKSFYCDMEHGSDYLKLFTEEIPALVKRWFKVTDDPAKTFIAGTSMGGYGAVKLALNRPDLFSAAASLSGALDLVAHIHDEWDASHLRTFGAIFDSLDQIKGSANDLIHQVRSLEAPPATRFFTCCGVDDYLHPDSVAFRAAAEEKGLHLTHHESAGAHEWPYWDTWIQRVLEWLPIATLSEPAR